MCYYKNVEVVEKTGIVCILLVILVVVNREFDPRPEHERSEFKPSRRRHLFFIMLIISVDYARSLSLDYLCQRRTGV